MSTKVKMPQLGESVIEGTVSKWLKKVGDSVKRDETIAEVTSDKVDVEIPAPAAGVLTEILVGEDMTVEVDTDIAVIEEDGGVQKDAEAKTEEKELKKKVEEDKSAAAPIKKKSKEKTEDTAIHHSPAVQKMAEQYGVDLSEISGTGHDGRVTKHDIIAYMEDEGIAQEKEVSSAKPAPAGDDEESIPLQGMRKAIAAHMVLSKRTAPHVTTVAEVDLTNVVNLRTENKESFLKVAGVKLTYMPFIIKATCDALTAFPMLNSSMGDQKIILKKQINLGVAVGLDDGLIVPVIKAADKKCIRELAHAVNDLATRARQKALTPEEVQNGTFTITNPGIFGAILSTPIIFQPQAAILGVEAIRKMPVVIDDGIVVRSVMNLCLSYDHRIVDGAMAGRFLQHIRKTLEAAEFSLD